MDLLVVGAGPTGLAVMKALNEAGISFVGTEAHEEVGGNWHHGVYPSAAIISSRRTTEFPDDPMPASWPDFPSAAQMAAYYKGFADRHDLRRHIRFRSEVASVRPDGDAWTVTWNEGASERFRGVLVANGHHWDRRWPSWIDAFRGERLHSKDYKQRSQLDGRRVLVIGAGNSGCDLVCESSRFGASVDWSIRRGVHILPKSIGGRPTVEWMSPWLPVPVQRALMAMVLRITVGPLERLGLPTPAQRLFETHPTVSSDVLHQLEHGRIRVRPDVASVEGTTVTFADGQVGTYDLVVCATGFHVSFPFLPAGLVPVDGPVARLVGGMVRPDARHLWVLATGQARYGIGPLLRPMAQLLAEWIGLQDELSVPLGRVLMQAGVRVSDTHLVDPHQVLRDVRRGRRATPWLRRLAARHGWVGAPGPVLQPLVA